MTKTFLTAVSAIAIMAATPAMAEMKVKAGAEATAQPGSTAAAEQSTGNVTDDAKNAWKDIKEDTSNAYEKAKENTSEAYNDIKATVVGENANEDIVISSNTTATGMIGKPVHNANGESIGKVTDIILDQNGKASMVVVADGEFIGMGKKAAFDYNTIANINADGDVIMPLTEAMIENAAEFSYDAADAGDGVSVMSSNGYSVAKLLDGQVVNQNKNVVGEIDNISFVNGSASQLIVGFDKILGLGGKKASLNFSSATMIKDGDGYDFQLSAAQSKQFENYKNTATN